MLFEFKDNNKKDFYGMNFDYFNLNNVDKNVDNYSSKNGKIDLENGFYMGNIFVDTYKPYKNFKPMKVNAYSDEQKMLLRIQELDFILNDLNLYLDINPNDSNVYNLFKKNAMELDSLKKRYEERYPIYKKVCDVRINCNCPKHIVVNKIVSHKIVGGK